MPKSDQSIRLFWRNGREHELASGGVRGYECQRAMLHARRHADYCGDECGDANWVKRMESSPWAREAMRLSEWECGKGNEM